MLAAVEQGGRKGRPAAARGRRRHGGKVVAAEKNGGVGMENSQVQGEMDPIYRRSPRVRVSYGLGWAGPEHKIGLR